MNLEMKVINNTIKKKYLLQQKRLKDPNIAVRILYYIG